MNIIKTLMVFTLLLTSTLTLQANDYALVGTYPLLNDMKMAKKQEKILLEMSKTISDHKNNNKNKLSILKQQFTTVIDGLLKGDNSLHLHGTKLVILKNKIKTIKLLWSQEKSILDSAINNKMYEDEAYATIKKLTRNLTTLNKLYNQSYTRYKQNSVMKSLVKSYMNSTTTIEPKYAFNTIR